jgi:hypothetical protein
MNRPIIDTETLNFPQDLLLQRDLEVVLHRHYPGHFWHVDVNIRQGFINIKNLFLSGMYGFRIDLRGIFSASEVERDVMIAGGELLERYKMKRGAFDLAQFEGLKTDFAGRHIADRG